MVIKVYTSGISGNKEVKKRQQRIVMILESKGIEYEAVDITEPGNEDDKQFMQDHAKPKEGAKHPLPPQIFNELEYCGDYEGFDVANENDELEVFLKMPLPNKPVVITPIVNGSAPEPEPEPEHSTEKDSNSQVPERDEPELSSVTDKVENELEKPSNVKSEENSEAKETESSEENGLTEDNDDDEGEEDGGEGEE